MAETVLANETIHYFKRTVGYVVGGRRYIGDPIGFVLTPEQPWVAVPESRLRDFRLANKRAFQEGLIIETEEPSVDWDTVNTYTDEQIDELLKSYLKLKKALGEITSVATVSRMLARAKDQRRSEKTLDLLEERLDEIDTDRERNELLESKLNT